MRGDGMVNVRSLEVSSLEVLSLDIAFGISEILGCWRGCELDGL